MPFAQQLIHHRIAVFPIPVLGLMRLLRGFCMARQASLGDFRLGREFLLEFLELGVIGSAIGRDRLRVIRPNGTCKILKRN